MLSSSLGSLLGIHPCDPRNSPAVPTSTYFAFFFISSRLSSGDVSVLLVEALVCTVPPAREGWDGVLDIVLGVS